MPSPDPRYFYVVVDETPVAPDRPLLLDEAITQFRECIAELDDDETIDLRQCTPDDLEWAGMEIGDHDA